MIHTDGAPTIANRPQEAAQAAQEAAQDLVTQEAPEAPRSVQEAVEALVQERVEKVLDIVQADTDRLVQARVEAAVEDEVERVLTYRVEEAVDLAIEDRVSDAVEAEVQYGWRTQTLISDAVETAVEDLDISDQIEEVLRTSDLVPDHDQIEAQIDQALDGLTIVRG